jgi:hypothetical protein
MQAKIPTLARVVNNWQMNWLGERVPHGLRRRLDINAVFLNGFPLLSVVTISPFVWHGAAG